MLEKDFRKIWKKVSDMELSGQAQLDALHAELEKAELTETIDWSWSIDQIDRFIQIMEEMMVMRRGRGMVYLVFTVMLYNKLEGKNRTVEAICELVAYKYETTLDEVLQEIAHFQKDTYDNLTGVRAMVNPNAKKVLDTYFGGNEGIIQSPNDFIIAIAKAM